MFSSLINGLDSVFVFLSSILKQNVSDYCDLETAQDEISLVSKDGSLLSIVRINGIKSLISGQTFYNTIVGPLSGSLQNYLEKSGHTIQFWFTLDHDKTEKVIKDGLEPAYQTAKRLDLDLAEMLDERVSNLAQWTAVEDNYMVLWTRPSALVKSDLKEAKKRKQKMIISQQVPMNNGGDPFRGISMLQERHNAFVEAVAQEFEKCGLSVTVLGVKEASRSVRRSIDDSFTDYEWEPFLPGDPIKPHVRKVYSKAEEWDIIWPRLSWQVCPRDAIIVDSNFVEMGDRIYAPLYIDLMPKDANFFGDLFGRLINKKDLPFRISYTIEGDGLASVAIKGLFATILSATSGDNRLLSKAVKELKDLKENQHKTIVKFKISLCTWADKGKKDDLKRRVSDLARGVESWGSCLVSEVTGDPIAGVFSSALGVTAKSIATPSAAPLEEAVFMLPLTRPCSPWTQGAVTFRSPDGKLMPYQPGSSLQTTWISLIFAKPGSGKSVLMNMTNLAICLAPGIQRLPRVGIVDIGPSSSGLISLIRESLPINKKHLAAYHRIRMTEEFCINPFDTQLGCRYPTAEERGFLSNLLCLLATDPAQINPEQGMSGLVAQIIDEMYRRCSDKVQPKPYDPNIEPKVDDAINKAQMPVDSKTTWWEVVDYLFSKDYIHEAMIAQRHAVPVLSDAAACAQEEKIKSVFERVEASTKETLIQCFNRLITDSLNYYRILSRPTVFDLGESRIVSLDLDEVAKGGGPIAERQTAVMYMLARYILGKDFKLVPETINEMPYPAHIECPSQIPSNKYKAFHKERIEEIKEDLKRLCFDEFHRTSKAPLVREQILTDMREGRKWNMDITLASQSLNDFDEEMKNFATGIFIMDGGNAQTIEEIGKVFGISDPAEKDALMRRVHGPKKGGGTFLAKFNTKQGWYTQLLTSTLGPVELWAFSTTSEDANIRNRLYDSIGPANARRILALAYPGGSAKDYVEKRKEQMKNNGQFSDDESNIYEQIIEELIKKYNHIIK